MPLVFSNRQEEHKLAIYVDDLCVYLTNTSHSLEVVMEEIKPYSTVSDYKLNMGKSEAMVVGQSVSHTIVTHMVTKPVI